MGSQAARPQHLSETESPKFLRTRDAGALCPHQPGERQSSYGKCGMELIVLLINLLMGFVLGYSFRAAHGCCEFKVRFSVDRRRTWVCLTSSMACRTVHVGNTRLVPRAAACLQ